MYLEFKDKLKKRLEEPLPASESHKQVMRHRRPLDQMGMLPEGARESAVLILIYPKDENLHTVFIQRPVYKGVHSGQIAFPGGKAEEEDFDLQATAYREAEEELNVQPSLVEPIGKLTPLFVPPSNFIIHPFIAFQESLPAFRADPKEVSSFIETPIRHFISTDSLRDSTVMAQNNRLKVKAFQYEGHIIWGATGMILKEFVDVLNSTKLPSGLI